MHDRWGVCTYAYAQVPGEGQVAMDQRAVGDYHHSLIVIYRQVLRLSILRVSIAIAVFQVGCSCQSLPLRACIASAFSARGTIALHLIGMGQWMADPENNLET